MGWQFRLQVVWNARLKQKLQTKTTNASLKAVHQRNIQSRQFAKVELVTNHENKPNHDETEIHPDPLPARAADCGGVGMGEG
jgi:hypothetical protein